MELLAQVEKVKDISELSEEDVDKLLAWKDNYEYKKHESLMDLLEEKLEAYVAKDTVIDKDILLRDPEFFARKKILPLEEMEVTIQNKLSHWQYAALQLLLEKIKAHPLVGDDWDLVVPYFKEETEATLAKTEATANLTAQAWVTGRRKTSSARVGLWVGSGQCKINGLHIADYFSREKDRLEALQTLRFLGLTDYFDVVAFVAGGGPTGQAGAISLGVSRALTKIHPGCTEALDKAGFLTRDPRMVERKKPGQKKARKKFTWVKR